MMSDVVDARLWSSSRFAGRGWWNGMPWIDAGIEGAAMLGMLCSFICVRIATCWTRARILSLMSSRAEGDVEDDRLERPRLELLEGPLLDGSDEDDGGSPELRDPLDVLDSFERWRERGTIEDLYDLEDRVVDWLVVEALDE